MIAAAGRAAGKGLNRSRKAEGLQVDPVGLPASLEGHLATLAQPTAHARAVMIPRVPEAEWDSDDRVPPMVRPIGPGVEIARGADWSVMVSRSQDGFCISHVDSGGGSGFAHGRLPSPGSRSKHVVAIVGRPIASRKEAVGFVAGLVMANVARVEVKLRDGTTISAQTEAAPNTLDADLRTFVITTPFDEQTLGPDFSPWVREYVLRVSDGAVLERLANSRRPRRT